MYLIFKDTDKTKEIIAKLRKMDPNLNVNVNTCSVVVSTKQKTLVGSITFIENVVKVWPVGEPNRYIMVPFRTLISVRDL